MPAFVSKQAEKCPIAEHFTEKWGNHSSAYKFGSKIKGVIETARAQVAEWIWAPPHEIIFTASGQQRFEARLLEMMIRRLSVDGL